MAKNDLTLGDVEEARRWNISPDQYDQFRTAFGQRAVSKYQDEREMAFRAELEVKYDREQKALIRKQIEDEISSTQASPRQKDAARRACGEIELDALTAARAASTLADKNVKELDDEGGLRLILSWVMLLTLLPVLAICHHFGWSFETFAFWATAIPYVVAVIASFATCDDYRTKTLKRIEGYRTRTKEYRAFAQKVRDTRLVHIETASTRADLSCLLGTVTNGSPREENADLVLPSDVLDAERVRVRDALSGDMDPDMFLRGSDVLDQEAPHKAAQA